MTITSIPSIKFLNNRRIKEAVRLSEKVANERIRKERKGSKKTLSSYEIEPLKWNILIINAPKEMLSVEAASALYRLR